MNCKARALDISFHSIMQGSRDINLKVKRQDGPGEKPYWQDFLVRATIDGTVSDLLKLIESDPLDSDGQAASPVVWEHGCGDGRCGSCAMLINGKPLLACRAKLMDFPPAPIILEPFSKFPVVRDLWVDRTALFDVLKRAEVWIENVNYGATSECPDVHPDAAERALEYGRCIHCGICLESCPSFTKASKYIGPAAIASSAAYQELSPETPDAVRMQKNLMQPGGITGCGYAMNCAKLCPMDIPLTNAIAATNRRVNTTAWKNLKRR